MPDIMMCKGTGCPLKEQCYRAKAKSSTYQSFFIIPPHKDGNCDFFWVMKKNGNENLVNK